MVTTAQYLWPFTVTMLMMVLLDNLLSELGIFYDWCLPKTFSMRTDVSLWLHAVRVRLLRLLLLASVQELFAPVKIGFVTISFMQNQFLISTDQQVSYPYLSKIVSL